MPSIPSYVRSRTVDEEEVLLNLKTQKYFGMNAVATRIWNLMKAKQSEGQIARLLAAEYDAPPSRVHADIRSFVSDLWRRGLLAD